MSAFVVQNSTLNRAVSLWDRYENQPDAALDQLGREMLALNNKAVHDRYSHHPDCADMMSEPETVNDWRFRPTMVSAIAAYKALNCLIYQCSEGDCDQTAIYKAMKKMEAYAAHAIIEALPEYDAAAWDAEPVTI